MNSKYALLLLTLFLSIKLQAQTITGRVIDEKTGESISYVNLGIIGKNAGTVSNLAGNFSLSLDGLSDTDILRVSMITHHSKDFSIRELRTQKSPIIIKLAEKAIVLDEVVVRSKRRKAPKTRVLGIKRKWCYPVPFNKRVTSNIRGFASYLGEEIGTYYPVRDNKTYTLDSVQLNIYQAATDTIIYRLNVYDTTGRNMLKTPIYISMTRDEIMKSPMISLTKYNLKVEADFIVALENIEGIGGLTILATFKKKAKTFRAVRRKNNQSDWIRMSAEGLGSGATGISLLAYLNEDF